MKTTFKKTALGLASAVFAATGFAFAQTTQATVSNPSQTMSNFDPVNLGPLLSELGLVWRQQQTGDGRSIITANIGGELTVNFVPSACLNGASNCIGLVTLAQFEGGNFNPQSVSAFNQKYWFASAGIVSNGGSAYISRYDIADFGIPRGNIASSITNFYVLASKFASEIRSGAKTVSLDGFADDFSAASLNKQSLQEIGVNEAPQSHLEHHLDSFEAAPQLVKALIKDPNTARNKITNVTPQR